MIWTAAEVSHKANWWLMCSSSTHDGNPCHLPAKDMEYQITRIGIEFPLTCTKKKKKREAKNKATGGHLIPGVFFLMSSPCTGLLMPFVSPLPGLRPQWCCFCCPENLCEISRFEPAVKVQQQLRDAVGGKRVVESPMPAPEVALKRSWILWCCPFDVRSISPGSVVCHDVPTRIHHVYIICLLCFFSSWHGGRNRGSFCAPAIKHRKTS